MSKIIYFNINFACNNKCVFCFSHNVGEKCWEMEITKIKSVLDKSCFTLNDIIVINGGEPSIHSEFVELLKLLKTYECKCNIYTNGRKLRDLCFDVGENITFIIPIHGSKKNHDMLTRVAGAYDETVMSLKYLEDNNISYRIKFILTKEMIDEDFDILFFLNHNDLLPEEIYLSRINATIKSKYNEYSLPEKQVERQYLNKQLSLLRSAGHRIKILDFPPCYIDNAILSFNLDNIEHPHFYYNDFKCLMKERVYIKEQWQEHCTECKYERVCDYMTKSYYLFQYDEKVTLELE